MKRTYCSFSATLLTGAALFLCPVTSAHAGELTLKNVTLSSGGLAQFDWAASVDGGDISLTLPVRSSQVDDILKSLVVYDTTGSITDVSLAGRESLKQLFTDLPFSQDDLNHPASLLTSLKGQKIAVEGPQSVTGRLVNVYKRPVLGKDGKTLTNDYILTVLGDKGMKEVTLNDLNAVKFLDPALNADLERALEAVKTQSNRDTKTVDIRLSGKDKRDVKISYTVPAPLWKAAYRIVLPEAGNTKSEAFVQGWAVLENTTGGDWKDINLSLVSGNPVTYHQALYDSYNVDRPTLPVEIFGRVMPHKDTGDFEMAAPAQNTVSPPQPTPMRSMIRAGAAESLGEPLEVWRKTVESKKVLSSQRHERLVPEYKKAVQEKVNIFDAVAAPEMMAAAMPETVAQSGNTALSNEAAGQMVFDFPQKLSLASGSSMMVPFINSDYKAKRIYLYQPDVNAEHPLSSLEITNSGKTGLPPGIVTLYSPDGKATNTYIGDAQMPAVNAGEDRMLSFAIDGKTSIKSEYSSTQQTSQVSMSAGVVKISQVSENTATYTVKAPTDEDRTVIIEHPKSGGDWTLTAPKDGVKETATHYRISVTVKAGEQKDIPVTISHTDYQNMSVSDMTGDTINYYISSWKNIPDNARAVFEQLAGLRRTVDDLNSKLTDLQSTRYRVFADQNRIRSNLQSVTRFSKIHSRYQEQLTAQEDRLLALENEITDTQSKHAAAEKALKDYIAGVKI